MVSDICSVSGARFAPSRKLLTQEFVLMLNVVATRFRSRPTAKTARYIHAVFRALHNVAYSAADGEQWIYIYKSENAGREEVS